MNALKRYTRKAGGVPLVAAALALSVAWGCQASVTSGDTSGYKPFDVDIVVKVTDGDGGPLKDATGNIDATVSLYVLLPNGALWLETTMTNAGGEAIFSKPDIGSYMIFASASTYLGGSAWALVTEQSVLTDDIELVKVSEESLADYKQTQIGAAGGTAPTGSIPGLAQSSVTFPPGVVSGDIQVTVGTLTGEKIPVPPASYGPITTVLVDLSGTGEINGESTIEFGLPFTGVPVSTPISVFIFDEATGTWELLGDALVVESQAKPTRPAGGTPLTARKNMLIKGNSTAIIAVFGVQSVTVESVTDKIELPPSDETEVTIVWVPILTFPATTNYSDTTQTWIRSILERHLGLTFGDEMSMTLTRDPNVAQVLYSTRTVEDYTISHSFPDPRSSPRAARASKKFYGTTETEAAEIFVFGHESGSGGGG